MSQQFQQFQHQQQELQRERMMHAAWMEQQKRSRKAMQAQVAGQSQYQVDPRFSLVEQEAGRLRQQFAAGRISQLALEADLRNLMVQDSGGTWWSVGAESGRWYRFDGTQWVPGRPGQSVASSPPGGTHATFVRRGSKVKALIVLVVGVAVSVLLFFAAGSLTSSVLSEVDSDVDDLASLAVAVVVGLIGLITSWRLARRAARGS